jgi:hypothetical protein
LVDDAMTEPMRVVASEGAVVVLGPNGIAGALTPAAAEESARRLITAARQARVWTETPPSPES